LLFIDTLLPDVLALPWQEGSWTVLISEHLAYVRTGTCDGFACDLDMLLTLLELGLEESEAQKPEKLNVYSEQTSTHLIELEKLSNIIINTQILDMPAFVFLAENLSGKPALNLLQGDYQANRELAEIKKRWLLAGGIAAAWLFVSASFAMTQFFYWEHKNNQLTHQIKTIYQKNFPQATTFDDPRLRIQNELQALQNQASGGHFLSLLGSVGEVLHSLAATSMQHKGLTFSTGSLVLELQVNNFAALQNLTGLLQQKGLTVKQDSATTNAQGVQAHLTITRGNSS
jgi:general secretion pathway protein L